MAKSNVPVPKDFPFAAVLWDDAHSASIDVIDKNSVAFDHKPMPIITTGWILRDDAIGISICCEYADKGDYRGRTFIPRAMVKAVKVIQKAKTIPPPTPPPPTE
jgi:hypothetical protein